MSAIESPSIDVKPIADDETFRVTIEAAVVVIKVDLRKTYLLELASEALEAVVTSELELEACSFCGPDGGLEEDGTCELEAIAEILRRVLRSREHKRGGG